MSEQVFSEGDLFDPFSLHSPPRGSPVRYKNKNLPLEGEIFDPFGLGKDAIAWVDDASSTASPQPPPELNRLTRSKDATDINLGSLAGEEASLEGESIASRKSVSLPPKLVVKFTLHEEVTSVAKTGAENEGASDITAHGNLHAQIQSSDALKNSPFALVASTLQGGQIEFRANDACVSHPKVHSPPIPPHALHLVQIPKNELGGVLVGSYAISERVRHMPLLVERKVTMYSTTCRVAVQVRSKLSNKGDLGDFTIAVAMPEHVDGDTVEVLRGDGRYDELKRTIRWNMKELPRGESFMVSAQAQLWSPLSDDEQDRVRFPVLARCSSTKDQISSVDFRATEAEDHPASVTYYGTKSFRLLHRLP